MKFVINHLPRRETLYLANFFKNIKQEAAFSLAVNYLQENDEQLTIQDLIPKMGQLSEHPFSFKHRKRRLPDY